ncbi:tetratricopeptide repeat protein [Pseudohoeflea coraliihabitans]|uniref:Sel1 repeat family protein n=1 Tax=Pseudohoeflea coraliihabitans TaxID=2860393 RepID=A0ABS6WPI8_9HYPH|nr:tetratricopeptide repeat protein [Pseudohoeflea sp. DP4N28-3]MBW3097868.1 sel1 repeat family protein [Pseudohoeflea sp. DP4N28-3]
MIRDRILVVALLVPLFSLRGDFAFAQTADSPLAGRFGPEIGKSERAGSPGSDGENDIRPDFRSLSQRLGPPQALKSDRLGAPEAEDAESEAISARFVGPENEGDADGSGVAASRGPVLVAPTDDPALALLDDRIDATKRAYSAYQRGFYLTAMDLAVPRAQLGDPAAQTLIAELFAEGFGVARSMDDAAFWYEQAAKGGDAAAQFKLAIMLLEGKHVPLDAERSRTLMKQAADSGNPFAQFNHAQSLLAQHPGDVGLKRALPYFEKAAAQGVPDAQYALARSYMNALGIPEEKRAQARSWMRKAAQGGYDTAQLDLAIWLIDGVGGEKDYERGFRWMQTAALRGNVAAQNRLSVLYIHAIGTRPDPIEAAKWYILSKRAGYTDPELEDFYLGLTAEEQKAALDRANRFARR